MTRRTILKPGDKVDLSTEIWASDLTEEGNKFIEMVQFQWARFLDRKGTPTDTSVLAKALAQLRNLQSNAAAARTPGPAEANPRKQGAGGKRKEKRAAVAEDQAPPESAEELGEASGEDDPFVYDKAKWHFEGDFPEDLPQEQAFVHTGMFAGWLMEHDMVSEDFLPEAELFNSKEITGPQAYAIWDGGLDSDMVTPEGNQFAREYYREQFARDYEELLVRDLPSFYHVQDTWENYAILKRRIDARFAAWKKAHRQGKGKSGHRR